MYINQTEPLVHRFIKAVIVETAILSIVDIYHGRIFDLRSGIKSTIKNLPLSLIICTVVTAVFTSLSLIFKPELAVPIGMIVLSSTMVRPIATRILNMRYQYEQIAIPFLDRFI